MGRSTRIFMPRIPTFPINIWEMHVMASFASLVRISARQSACWRECKGCTGSAPLAPNETHCRACRTARRRVTTRRPAAA